MKISIMLDRRWVLFLVLALSLSSPLPAEENKDAKKTSPRDLPIKDIFAEKEPSVEVVADNLEYQRDEKKIIGKGNVVITYENRKITADYAEVETDTKKAYARGHVILFRKEEATAQGHEVYYDFGNHKGSFPNGRMVSDLWFTKGADIQQLKEGVTVVKNASVTTCNLEKPHYEIRAKKATLRSEDKIVLRNVTIYALGKPIFWWPYLIIPLQKRHIPLSISAGHRSDHGAYILVSKGITINKNLGGQIHADWRSKRGFGGGIDIGYNMAEHTSGLIKTYWTQDKRAPTPGLPNPYAERERRDRGRIKVLHRTDIDLYSYVQLRYNRLADEFFLQEFFEQEHRADIAPQSFATATKNGDRYGFYTHVEKRMNSFESIVERLPEVRFNWKNQPLFKPWLQYQSELSFANLGKTFGRVDKDEDVTRFDFFNEWFTPYKWNEWKLTPFVSARGTYYSRERESSDDHFRTAFGLGADVRTHFYKTYAATFDKFGIEINHLRHIVEPSIRYQSILHSSVSDEQLGLFDEVDRVDNQDIVTFGIENRVQTKRVIRGRTQRVDLVSLNTYLSYEIHPDGRSLATNFAPIDDGQTASNFTILNQEITVRPYEWLLGEIRFDYDFPRNSLRVFNDDIVLRVRRFKLLFGHRFTNDIAGAKGSNQFVFQGSYIINPLWELGAYIRWDAEIDGLQEWQVAAKRDLHDFILEFGYTVRNSLIESNNRELFFNFRLKLHPGVAIRAGGGRSSFSEPRIGETVAGSSPIPEVHEEGIRLFS